MYHDYDQDTLKHALKGIQKDASIRKIEKKCNIPTSILN